MDQTPNELLVAIKNRRHDKVKEIVNNGLSGVDCLYETALKLSIDTDDAAFVRLLVGKELARLDDVLQFKPIMYATTRANVHADVLTVLLQSGRWDVNETDTQGLNALHISSNYRHVNKLEVLLQTQDLDVNSVDDAGQNALHHLLTDICLDDIDTIKRCLVLLLDHGVDINKQDRVKETPLHKVFQSNYECIPTAVTLILQNAKDINHELKDLDGFTVFHIMVSDIDQMEGDEHINDIVKEKEKLIQNFLNGEIISIPSKVVNYLLNEPDNKGHSPFQTYVDNKHYSMETIESMVQLGANIHPSTNLGISPLMQAAIRERDSVVEFLLKSGADVNKQDIFGQTAIFRARTEKSLSLLCEYGAHLGVKDRWGRSPVANRDLYTPLGFPSFGMNLEPDLITNTPLAKCFFDYGVDVNCTDRYGSSLLHYAAWYSDINMIEILLENGANKDQIDNLDYTPFDLAILHCNYETFDLLKTGRQQIFNMDTLEKQKQEEHFSSFTHIIINHKDIEDMKKSLELINADKTDAEDLIEHLMSSPRIGFTEKLRESSQIRYDVHKLMQTIAVNIGELDGRFSSKLFPTGSSAEKTQVGDPVEMDFVFCLTYFEDQCEVIQTEDLLQTGFAYLKLKNYRKSHDLAMFVEENNMLRSDLIRNRFQNLVITALNTEEIWSVENLYFDGLLKLPDDKPILNLQIQWFGAVAKAVNISIDIVPAIHKTQWIPRDIDKDAMNSTLQNIEAGFFLIFHLPQHGCTNNEHLTYVRISSAPSEIKLLQSVPEIFKESYSLSKILKSRYFCPFIQFSDDEDESDEEECQSDFSDTDESSREDEKFNQRGEGTCCDQIETNVSILLPCSDNEKTVANSNDRGIEKAPGWVVCIDESSVIRKVYLPKNDNMKPLEKFFSIATNGALSNMKDISNGSDCSKEISVEINGRRDEFCINEIGACNDMVDADKNHIDETGRSGALENETYTGNKKEPIKIAIKTTEMIPDDSETFAEIECSFSDMSNDELTSDTESELVGGAIALASDEISSYMLKNCLFYVLQQVQIDSNANLTHLSITKMIYQTLLESAKEKKLASFFMPYIDIFSYINTHIRMVASKKSDKEISKHCARIEAFCKVILGILSQTKTKS